MRVEIPRREKEIVGPGDKSDRFTYWVARMARGGDVLAPGAPEDPIRLIDVRDLADWLVKLAIDHTPGVFDAIGPKEPLTVATMLEACRAAAGTEIRLVWADAGFLEKNAVALWTDLPVWLPPTSPTRGFHLRSNATAIEAGLTFRPIEDSAKVTLEWWRGLSEERRAKPKYGIDAKRERELLDALAKRCEKK